MPAVVRYEVSRGEGDCAIVALAIYLQRTYEDVLAAAVSVTAHADPHHRGLHTREIRAIAKRLGTTLRLRRGFDVDDDEGILGLLRDGHPGHVAFVKRGLVWDGDATVWELDAYLTATSYRPVSLLVEA